VNESSNFLEKAALYLPSFTKQIRRNKHKHRLGGTLPSKPRAIHCAFSSSDVGGKWQLPW